VVRPNCSFETDHVEIESVITSLLLHHRKRHQNNVTRAFHFTSSPNQNFWLRHW